MRVEVPAGARMHKFSWTTWPALRPWNEKLDTRCRPTGTLTRCAIPCSVISATVVGSSFLPRSKNRRRGDKLAEKQTRLEKRLSALKEKGQKGKSKKEQERIANELSSVQENLEEVTQEALWLKQLHGLRLRLWTGEQFEVVSMLWQSKRLARDFGLDLAALQRARAAGKGRGGHTTGPSRTGISERWTSRYPANHGRFSGKDVEWKAAHVTPTARPPG